MSKWTAPPGTSNGAVKCRCQMCSTRARYVPTGTGARSAVPSAATVASTNAEVSDSSVTGVPSTLYRRTRSPTAGRPRRVTVMSGAVRSRIVNATDASVTLPAASTAFTESTCAPPAATAPPGARTTPSTSTTTLARFASSTSTSGTTGGGSAAPDAGNRIETVGGVVSSVNEATASASLPARSTAATATTCGPSATTSVPETKGAPSSVAVT